MLSDRQELVLRRLVEEYLELGAPVGSKALSAEFEWGPSTIRHELANLEDLGLRAHPETLSPVTTQMAIVTAPPIETSTIRHIEVLTLQPQVLMAVVITSTGGVTKRLFTFPRPVDTGIADWAGSYLDERLVGLGLGARVLHQRLHDPSLSAAEREFLEALSPVFTDLEESAQATLYVDGTARLLTVERIGDV